MLVSACVPTIREFAEPPTLLVPDWVSEPCRVGELPDDPTDGDIDAAVIERGAEIANCDTKRENALSILKEERAAVRKWLRDR